MPLFDFDLRSYFRLRLVDASEKEAAVITRQLGPIAAPVSGEADLTIRFVDSLPDEREFTYIGLNDAAFTPDAFYVLKGKQKSTVKVQIPFETLGEPTEIVCERGIKNIPLLIPMMNFRLLAKGILPLHASAFIYKGQGALITGWAKGGKTEVLLGFMAQGASYVGDEWVYLCPDGTTMFGVPEPIRVWNWHLDSLPLYRARLKKKDLLRLNSLSTLSRSMDWITRSKNGGTPAPVRLLQRINPLVQRQLYVHFPPHYLFGADKVQFTGTIDKVIFAASHRAPAIDVSPASPDEIARRMIFSLAEEYQEFYAFYHKFRFAFPNRPNPRIEQSEETQRKMLESALRGKPAIAITHPYPVQIPALFDALRIHFD